METMKLVLTRVLEDDADLIEVLAPMLESVPFVTAKFYHSSDEFLEDLNENVHLCLVDYKLPGKYNGIEVVSMVKSTNPWCKFIMISGIEDCDIVTEFFHRAGKDVTSNKYVNKNKSNYLQKIVQFTSEIIDEIKIELEKYNDLRQMHEEIKLRQQKRKSLERTRLDNPAD